jgi:hypothetical protein
MFTIKMKIKNVCHKYISEAKLFFMEKHENKILKHKKKKIAGIKFTCTWSKT